MKAQAMKWTGVSKDAIEELILNWLKNDRIPWLLFELGHINNHTGAEERWVSLLPTCCGLTIQTCNMSIKFDLIGLQTRYVLSRRQSGISGEVGLEMQQAKRLEDAR
jgi:hypothetical protein